MIIMAIPAKVPYVLGLSWAFSRFLGICSWICLSLGYWHWGFFVKKNTVPVVLLHAESLTRSNLSAGKQPSHWCNAGMKPSSWSKAFFSLHLDSLSFSRGLKPCPGFGLDNSGLDHTPHFTADWLLLIISTSHDHNMYIISDCTRNSLTTVLTGLFQMSLTVYSALTTASTWFLFDFSLVLAVNYRKQFFFLECLYFE